MAKQSGHQDFEKLKYDKIKKNVHFGIRKMLSMIVSNFSTYRINNCTTGIIIQGFKVKVFILSHFFLMRRFYVGYLICEKEENLLNSRKKMSTNSPKYLDL